MNATELFTLETFIQGLFSVKFVEYFCLKLSTIVFFFCPENHIVLLEKDDKPFYNVHTRQTMSEASSFALYISNADDKLHKNKYQEYKDKNDCSIYLFAKLGSQNDRLYDKGEENWKNMIEFMKTYSAFFVLKSNS